MSPILEPEELQRLTGYRRPADQLAELLRQGFYRARRSRNGTGPVVLERLFYDAARSEAEDRKREAEVREMSSTPEERAAAERRYEGSGLQRYAKAVRAASEAREADKAQYLIDNAATIAKEKAEARAEAKQNRRELVLYHANKRRAAKLHRTPAWANEDAIRAIYSQAQALTERTGVAHHVDHIIPLQGELVSGLHVENNLQVLPWRENVMKRNHFEVEA